MKGRLNLGDKAAVVDPAESFRVLFQFLKRFAQLGSRTIKVSSPKVVKTNGSLDQALVVQTQGSFRLAPQFFPRLVSLKILAGVEKIYSVVEEVVHIRGSC